MGDEALLDNLKHWRTTCGEEIWPLMRQAAARIEALQSATAALADRDAQIAGLVEAIRSGVEALIPMPGDDRQVNGTYAQGVFDALQIVNAELAKHEGGD